MVLYKRKPVKFLPPEPIEDEDAEVWHIPQTGEVFASYENYLTRMDFYKQRRFNDQISGHSGMTFFEAFKNELAGGEEVEAAFPEALKGPVLRKAQFQTISRLDHLVDLIFDNFKHDYFPGEAVTVFYPDDEKRLAGLVRDKVTIGARPQADGSMSKPITRYLIFVVGRDEESSFEETQVSRERGVFTKAMIRSFMRKTVAREAWNGAPWLVKPDYAAQYYIDTRVPPHLRYDTKLLERKQLQAQKRASLPNDPNAQVQGGPGGPVRLPELKPASKAHKGKGAAGAKGKWPQDVAMHGAAPSNADMLKIAREPTPPPPPKYPIEDLQLELRESFVRPALEFLCRDPPTETTNGNTNGNANGTHVSHIDMDSVGPLLETWDTLNVYCEIFKLDSFTFDDFVEAMCVASERVVVQLFEEIHCAVLKILVDSEADGGKVRITLPQLEDDDDSDEEDEDEDEEEEKTPEPEPKPTGRATRSSLAKAEAERIAAAAEEENLRVELETKHRAEDILEDYDWIEHLRKRDFPNGGWERIIVGLLHQLSKSERYEQRCEELLLKLVPPGEEPTQEGVSMNYAQMDLPYRVKALQIICMLTMETKTVRGYMEECSENMTKYRKDKIEWQRQKKQAIEELRQLNEQRKALQPPETAPNSPKPESIKDEEGESRFDADESQLTQDLENGDDTDQDNQAKRKRRKPQMEKQRKQEEEKEKKAKQKEKKDAVTPAVSKQLLKIQKEIQKQEAIIKNCEEEVAVIENDLREADCPRTRVLGKDRYWNRYYWFERNGMPYAGLPNSSTAEAEYANGCIWVQGPDELEREGYIDLPQEEQNEYKAKFGVTIPERKAKEEGGTSVFNARQWGYISDPAKVEELINWLDPRGYNELKLKKELVLFKDRIVQHMANRRKYLMNVGETDGAAEEAVATSKRTSSRIREKTPEPPSYKCLRWENTVALEELGHLHSDAPPKPRARKQTRKRESAVLEAAVTAPTKKTRRK